MTSSIPQVSMLSWPPASLDGQNMAVYDFDDEATLSAGRRLYPYAYPKRPHKDDVYDNDDDDDEYDDEVTVLVCRGSSQSQVPLTMLAEKHPHVEVLVLSHFVRAGEDDVYGSSSNFDSWGDTLKLVIMLHVSEGLFCNVVRELERVLTNAGRGRQQRLRRRGLDQPRVPRQDLCRRAARVHLSKQQHDCSLHGDVGSIYQ
jgi:hypothetical protein